VARLKALGFSGPYTGGRHQFMVRGSVRLVLPNPHRGEVGVDLGPKEALKRILRQAGIEEEEWLE
jgi:predicted RNA binding protein YcfA (HicA-like mRNA interferase family)